ncbi:MAG TPA: DUF423 domain-containing protein [Candidatus Acidoferrales bacterium]|nr:DUF423 domain-containing protein [Candidatus Acidoferrales bacterium]
MNATSAGALFGALGVVLGAFGAHALRSQLGPEMLAAYETGVRYQLLHALALLFVGRSGGTAPRPGASLAAWLLGAGIVLFSGSLYALALSGVRVFGVVTPLGGLCLIGGWLALARSFWRR